MTPKLNSGNRYGVRAGAQRHAMPVTRNGDTPDAGVGPDRMGARGKQPACRKRKVPMLGSHKLRGRGPSVSVVLPAYNEEAIIQHTVHHVAGVLRTLTDDFEIVVADDGSRDRTGAILQTLRAQEPELRLRIVTHERNRGYGAALASGFDAARKDLIFF